MEAMNPIRLPRVGRILIAVALASTSLMTSCAREADPRVYKADNIVDYVPDHVSVAQDEVVGTHLRPEYFDPYYTIESYYIVSIGDVLEISIFGHDDTVIDQVSVAPDGRIYYLFIDGIDAAGRGLQDIQTDLIVAAKSMFITPEISIIPKHISSHSFRVLGKVVHPGVFPLTTATTLRQAIGAAGGIRYGGFAGTTINIAN
ncbi:MAG: polysaccharide biosynthesis/export family protein, partial [Chlamydiia bacterium]|nr:polysaccharide biosynthesis/export family protein [Chlamydiia bacterium]